MDDDYWENYESGPFCRHWSYAYDCDDVCATCGHRCIQHDFSDPGACDSCECEAWKEDGEHPLDREAVIETKEGIERKLTQVETKLVHHYQIDGADVRAELIRRIRSCDIPETAEVMGWLYLYSALVHWVD